ncbi:MAG TPA: AAA family ATPase [Candidatus Polarisedimenticolaceae bacterium]|nr:AAA family ATPase [Candidatus Polarisedimenticolaceae bacterium]
MEFEETRQLDPADVPRLISGTTLARRYKLESELGRGGMGIVFRASDLTLEREVAVKVLPEAAVTGEARERLFREARAAASLNHPGIVAVHDVGEHLGIPFFVMELVDGKDLHAQPPKTLQEIVALAGRILDALEHAHAHGIVHRDLKPENVLLSRTGVKLADLGVAFRADARRVTDSGAIVGTVSYMAPEQALGEAVDGRADLYALGVMLYELVTGRLPFAGSRPLEVVSQHVHAPVIPPRALKPDLPAALDAAIVKLLAKQPAHRFASAAEAKAALERALTAAPAPESEAANVALLEALARGKLVGRADELAEARELWRRAQEGSGHALLISGEPGAGKTRLARELQIQAALDGALVLTGACYEYEAATPYLPFTEAFRRLVRDEPDRAKLAAALGDSAPRLAKLAPEIEARLGPFPELPALAPHEERLLFFDAVAEVLRRAARSRSVLFYIDDLHWSDSSSLWLLAHLLRRLKDERVLFAASYREIELDRSHPLSSALVDWNRERLTTRLALKRFGKDQTKAQLEALLCESVTGEFADAIYHETEGNPFFVEEVLKSLIDQGSIRRDGGGWRRDDVRDLAIPQSVKAAIGHRLDKVPQAASDVLRAAAVLGKSFEFRELMAVAGEKGEDALLDAVDSAVAAQLLIAGRDESFAFTHDKIREVLYEELNPIRRRRLHKRTAEGLEKIAANRPICAEKLAHHYVEAGEHEHGLTWAKRAGEDATRVFAYDEAIAAYQRGIECAQVLGRDDEVLALEETAGRTQTMAGNLVAGLAHFERALALTQDPIVRAGLQIAAAGSLVAIGDMRGVDYVRRALEVLDPKTRPVEVATALMIEGRFQHLVGQHRAAADLLEKAAALAVPPEDAASLTPLLATTLTQIHLYTAGAYQHLGLFNVSDTWASRCVAYGEKYKVLYAQAGGYEFLGENAWSRAEWTKCLEYAALETEIANRLHSRERMAWIAAYSGSAYAGLGDHRRAAEVFADGIALAEIVGDRRVALIMHAYLGHAQASAGDIELGAATSEAAFARAEESKLLYMRTEAHRILGEIRRMQGRDEDAVALFEKVWSLTDGTDAKVSRLWTGAPHVEALLALGRRDEAKAVHARWAEIVAASEGAHFQRAVDRLKP